MDLITSSLLGYPCDPVSLEKKAYPLMDLMTMLPPLVTKV